MTTLFQFTKNDWEREGRLLSEIQGETRPMGKKKQGIVYSKISEINFRNFR
jgi:hypothetical protein